MAMCCPTDPFLRSWTTSLPHQASWQSLPHLSPPTVPRPIMMPVWPLTCFHTPSHHQYLYFSNPYLSPPFFFSFPLLPPPGDHPTVPTLDFHPPTSPTQPPRNCYFLSSSPLHPTRPPFFNTPTLFSFPFLPPHDFLYPPLHSRPPPPICALPRHHTVQLFPLTHVPPTHRQQHAVTPCTRSLLLFHPIHSPPLFFFDGWR